MKSAAFLSQKQFKLFITPWLTLLFLILYFWGPTLCYATNIKDFNKQLIAETIVMERYNITNQESITVGGFIYQRYLNSYLFWGGAGYGALYGQRGGYFIGGFVVGITWDIGKWIIEPMSFLGGGGGHGAPQGGGGIIRPSLAIGWKLTQDMIIKCHYGMIDFINGQIKSDVIGCSLGVLSYEILGN